MKYLNYLFALGILLATSAVSAGSDKEDSSAPSTVQPATGEQIKWHVIASGGGSGISNNHKIKCTIGQPAVGRASSNNYRLNAGFWQNFGPTGSCCNTAGDANNDGNVNVGDAVYMINLIFKSGLMPTCKDEGDANDDCSLNVGDAVFLINHVFKGGAAPQCGCVGT